MATIEIRTRDVKGTSFLPEHKTPQHTFLIYTKNNGDQYILRGGQDLSDSNFNNLLNTDNINAGDLEVVLDRYDWNGINENEKPIDWNDGDITIHSETIASGSQVNLQIIWNAMITEGQRINNEGYDYEYLTQNCNTSLSHMVQAGELAVLNQNLEVDWQGINLPDFEGQEFWTPGIDKAFSHSWVDNIFDFSSDNQTITTWDINNSLLDFQSKISPSSNNAGIDPDSWLQGSALHGGDYSANMPEEWRLVA